MTLTRRRTGGRKTRRGGGGTTATSKMSKIVPGIVPSGDSVEGVPGPLNKMPDQAAAVGGRKRRGRKSHKRKSRKSRKSRGRKGGLFKGAAALTLLAGVLALGKGSKKRRGKKSRKRKS